MIKYTLIFSIILALLFSLLQFSVNMAASIYENEHKGLTIELGKSWINPIDGTLSIADVSIKSEFEKYEIKELEIKISPTSIFTDNIEVQFVKLKHVQTINKISPVGTQLFGAKADVFHPSNIQIELSLEELLVETVNSNISINPSFTLKSFSLQQLVIVINEPSISEDHKTWLELEKYTADNIKWTEKGFEIGEHHITGLKQNYVFTKNKEIEPILTISKIHVQQDKKPSDTEEIKTNPPSWTLNKVEVTNSEITLFDLHNDSVWPLTIKSCALVNTTKPPLHDLTCGLETKGSTLAVQGTTNIYSPTLSSEINATLKGLNLVDLTSYFEPLSGYKVHTGILDLTSNIAIDNNALHAKNALLVRKLKVESVDESLAGSINKQLSMPLPMAISVLKNDQDNIELSLPVDGELGSPELNLNHIYSIVAKKAVKSALLYSIKNSFQPYASMISLGQLAGDYLFAIRLNPLEFELGSAELTKEHKEYLSIVNKTLIDNSSYQLTLCGFSTESEFKNKNDFDAKWKKLAITRSENVKQYIVNINSNINQKVITCQPQIHQETPRVEIGIN